MLIIDFQRLEMLSVARRNYLLRVRDIVSVGLVSYRHRGMHSGSDGKELYFSHGGGNEFIKWLGHILYWNVTQLAKQGKVYRATKTAERISDLGVWCQLHHKIKPFSKVRQACAQDITRGTFLARESYF